MTHQRRSARPIQPLRRLAAACVALLLLITLAPTSPADAATLDVYGPKPFSELLNDPLGTTWTPSASTIANRNHVVLVDAATKTQAIAIDDTGTPELVVVASTDVDATKGSALRAMFQLLDRNAETLATDSLTGTYRLHPELLSYFAVDADASTGATTASSLTVRDRNSFYKSGQSTIAHLVFTFDGTASSTRIQAATRLMFDTTSGTYVEDTSWSASHWLELSGGSLTLTTSSVDATLFTLADGADLIDVQPAAPNDINPDSIPWQTNSFAAFPGGEWDYDNSRLLNELLLDTDNALHSQFGSSASATTAAVTALDEIEATLTSQGAALRYDKSVYLAYRENALSHLIAAHDVYNAKLGQRTVAHVYFVNALDDSGVAHPFMVIASHDLSGGPNFLVDVARPPGDGTPGTMYEQQTITRRAILENKLVKIPLKDYGLVSDLADNDLAALGVATLAADEGLPEAQWTTRNHAGNASTGIAIDGVVIYPGSNNTLALATEVAEVTATGIHVGRGLGLHYHVDGHGFTENGINLYNISDYQGRSHPPMIGFGYDGVALFGRYEAAHSMDGDATALDDFGGHSHGDYGYHYHAHPETVTSGQATSYTQNWLLVGAWKGDVNNIPGLTAVGDAQLKDPVIGRFAGAPYDSSTPDGAGYVGVSPSRILDSRPAQASQGANTSIVTPWGAGVTRSVQVTGIGGVPASDVSAVALQVTSVSPTADSFLTVWPAGPRPVAASKNYGITVGGPFGHAGLTNDLLIVPVGPGGNVEFYNNAGMVDLVVDVVGYFAETAGDPFSALTPSRILDSRPAQASQGANTSIVTPWGAGVTRSVQVTGVGGVPATSVSAVALQVTSVGPTADSFLTAWPSGTQPVAASSNYGITSGGPFGHTGLTNELLIVPVGPAGTVEFYNNAGMVDLVVDVVGYFSPGGSDLFNALDPSRILDSRPTGASQGANTSIVTPWGAAVTRSVQVGGLGGVPASGVTAVALQVTSVSPTADSFLTVWPTGTRPVASSKNYGTTVGGPFGHTALSNDLLIVPVHSDGTVLFYNNAGMVDLVVDVVGYFS